MSQFKVPPEDRLSPFQIFTHAYKVVDGHSVLVDIRIPKKLIDEGPAGSSWKIKCPVIVQIHGGWLIGGQRNNVPWCALWLLELALKHNAILVSPDYRFLPEATGEQILDDMHDFWNWLASDLPITIETSFPGLGVDLDRVLVQGGSAGGYLSVQVALQNFKPAPSEDKGPSVPFPKIRALIIMYPMLDLRAPHWTQDYHKQIYNLPQYPNSLIDEHITAIKNAAIKPVLSNANLVGTFRGKLAIAVVQRGRLVELLGDEKDPAPGKRRLITEDRVKDGRKLPPTFFIHGIDDSGVPIGVTDRFIELLKEHKAVDGMEKGKADTEVLRFARVPGEHGFDSDLGAESTEWMKEGLAFVEQYWLN
ncbi:hypothetical protein EW145_g5225 [Phellinidium pouzarii]|uniref:Alpha/beta hydrolase fold-3 domain-containing protein n=1 Tax=Phellinidium pouzarii TaxID=167371 RepID=A0A4S4L190_9AGAM|nr:hypothetical protein EW145_g5225 [Phellinidium pouzarii]